MSKQKTVTDLSDEEIAEQYRWFKRLIKRKPETDLNGSWHHGAIGLLDFTPQQIFDEYEKRKEQRMESKGFEF